MNFRFHRTLEGNPEAESASSSPATPDDSSTEKKSEDPVIENPSGLLSAFEKLKAENKQLKSQIKPTEPQINTEEYEALKQFKAQVETEKAQQKEQQLKEQKRWEELLEAQTSRVSQDYENRIKLLSEQVDSLKSQYEETANQANQYQSQLTEYQLQQKALDSFLENGGRKDSFNYLWKGDLKDRLRLKDGKLEIVQDGELLTDGNGSPLELNAWMSQFKNDGGASFFLPAVNAGGGGAQSSPERTINSSNPKRISRADANNPKTLKRIATELGESDPLKLIRDGRVEVRD